LYKDTTFFDDSALVVAYRFSTGFDMVFVRSVFYASRFNEFCSVSVNNLPTSKHFPIASTAEAFVGNAGLNRMCFSLPLLGWNKSSPIQF